MYFMSRNFLLTIGIFFSIVSHSQDVKISWLEIDQGKRNEIEKVIRLSDTSILIIDNNASKPVGLKPIYISSVDVGEVNAVMSTSSKNMEVYRRFFSKDQFFEKDGTIYRVGIENIGGKKNVLLNFTLNEVDKSTQLDSSEPRLIAEEIRSIRGDSYFLHNNEYFAVCRGTTIAGKFSKNYNELNCLIFDINRQKLIANQTLVLDVEESTVRLSDIGLDRNGNVFAFTLHTDQNGNYLKNGLQRHIFSPSGINTKQLDVSEQFMDIRRFEVTDTSAVLTRIENNGTGITVKTLSSSNFDLLDSQEISFKEVGEVVYSEIRKKLNDDSTILQNAIGAVTSFAKSRTEDGSTFVTSEIYLFGGTQEITFNLIYEITTTGQINWVNAIPSQGECIGSIASHGSGNYFIFSNDNASFYSDSGQFEGLGLGEPNPLPTNGTFVNQDLISVVSMIDEQGNLVFKKALEGFEKGSLLTNLIKHDIGFGNLLIGRNRTKINTVADKNDNIEIGVITVK